MKGFQKVHIENSKAVYDLELHRNITVVRGKSGSGKTTLYSMVEDYTRRGDQSGIRISSSRPCKAILSQDWENALQGINNSIIFIDEGAEFICSKAFGKALQHSSNYFVLFTRENLYELPYSVNEIYEIGMVGRSKKKHCLKPYYRLDSHYSLKNQWSTDRKNIEILITEDSHSGYEFFRTCFESGRIKCQSCGSKTKIFQWLRDHSDQKVFVFAAGAAFGPEIDGVQKWQEDHPNQGIICLPESFEWLLLKSGVIPDSEIEEVLQHPENFVDSENYSSWERFFTRYLTDISAGQPYEYTKKRINPYFTGSVNAGKILGLIALDM